MIPPPNPKIEPKTPATKPKSNMQSVKANKDIFSPIFLYFIKNFSKLHFN